MAVIEDRTKYDSLSCDGAKARLRYKMLMVKKKPKRSVLIQLIQSMRIGDEPYRYPDRRRSVIARNLEQAEG